MPWSKREKLALACAVKRHGQENWPSVHKAIQPFVEHDAEFASQNNCAVQYAEILSEVQAQEIDGTKNACLDSAHFVQHKLTLDRMDELTKLAAEKLKEYLEAKRVLDELEAGMENDEDNGCKKTVGMENDASVAASTEISATSVCSDLTQQNERKMFTEVNDYNVEETVPDINQHLQFIAKEPSEGYLCLKIKQDTEIPESTSSKDSCSNSTSLLQNTTEIKCAGVNEEITRNSSEAQDCKLNSKSSVQTTGHDYMETEDANSAEAECTNFKTCISDKLLTSNANISTSDSNKFEINENCQKVKILDDADMEKTISEKPEKSVNVEMPYTSCFGERYLEKAAELECANAMMLLGRQEVAEESTREDIQLDSNDCGEKENLDGAAIAVCTSDENLVTSTEVTSVCVQHSVEFPEFTKTKNLGEGSEVTIVGIHIQNPQVHESDDEHLPTSLQQYDNQSKESSYVEIETNGTHLGALLKSENKEEPNDKLRKEKPAETKEEKNFHAAWKKSVMHVWKFAASHKYSKCICSTKRVTRAIKCKVDLHTIRKRIDCGEIKTTAEFQRDIMLMFNNALMNNSPKSATFSKVEEMYDNVMSELEKSLGNDVTKLTTSVDDDTKLSTSAACAKSSQATDEEMEICDGMKKGGLGGKKKRCRRQPKYLKT